MKQGTFEKEIFIQADPQKVLTAISDYGHLNQIHPLIIKVEQVQDVPAGVVRRYFITDSLQWGPFKFKIKYRADILAITEHSIHTEAYQAPGTYITNLTQVTPRENGALLHETVTLKAPDLLFGYAFSQADIAHTEMFKRVKKFIENQK